jgi:hypothetical protein
MNKQQAKELLRAAVKRLAAIDLHAVRIIPNGADEPLPPIPNEVIITPSDVSVAVADWDKTMPERRGKLTAKVINQRDYDG